MNSTETPAHIVSVVTVPGYGGYGVTVDTIDGETVASFDLDHDSNGNPVVALGDIDDRLSVAGWERTEDWGSVEYGISAAVAKQ